MSASEPDDALQRLLDAAEEAIVARIGEPDDYDGSRILLRNGGSSIIFLDRQAEFIEEVIEVLDSIDPSSYVQPSIYDWTAWAISGNATTLDATDYQLHTDKLSLRRLASGLNPAPRWLGTVRITYTPVDDTAERQRVQLALVELDLNYSPGLTSETVGSWSRAQAQSGGRSYTEMREDILASLGAEPPGWA